MDISSTTVDLPGALKGYWAHPAKVNSPLPGMLLIQEVWGVDGHIRDVAHRLAAAGYAVLAPDLYCAGGARPAALGEDRLERAKRFMDGVPASAWSGLMDPQQREETLNKLGAPDRQGLRETFGEICNPSWEAQVERFGNKLTPLLAWVRSQSSCRDRKVGALGFCVGGTLAGRLATEDAALGSAVMFYGAPPAAQAIPKIQCPVLGFYGEDDARLMPQLPAFERAMKDNQKSLEVRVYPKTPHAFFNDTRSSYRVEAARDAWARTLGFLTSTLAGD